MNRSVSQVKSSTLGSLMERVGAVAPDRVPSWPPPGMATEKDVLTRPNGEKRLCELVDGVLVEKTMGWYESRLAIVLILILETFLEETNLGIVLGEAGLLQLAPGLVRIPDVSFLSWERFAGGARPVTPILPMAPDLAVEILSPGNTEDEMNRKLSDYFDAGTRLVWYLYVPTSSVRVYTSPASSVLLTIDDELDGADVLPGFRLKIRAWLDRAWRQPVQP